MFCIWGGVVDVLIYFVFHVKIKSLVNTTSACLMRVGIYRSCRLRFLRGGYSGVIREGEREGGRVAKRLKQKRREQQKQRGASKHNWSSAVFIPLKLHQKNSKVYGSLLYFKLQNGADWLERTTFGFYVSQHPGDNRVTGASLAVSVRLPFVWANSSVVRKSCILVPAWQWVRGRRCLLCSGHAGAGTRWWEGGPLQTGTAQSMNPLWAYFAGSHGAPVMTV